jgi:hypothetical protein
MKGINIFTVTLKHHLSFTSTLLKDLGFEELCNGARCHTIVMSFHCKVRHFHVEKA